MNAGLGKPSLLFCLRMRKSLTGLAGIFLSVVLVSLCVKSSLGPYLIWIAVTPWLLATRGVSPRQGLLFGLLFGFLTWASATWWIVNGVRDWAGLSVTNAWIITGLFHLYQGVPYGLFGLCRGLFAHDGPVLTPLGEALLLTVFVFGFPHLMPGSLANVLYPQPLLIQSADLGGTPLVLFIIVFINSLLAGGLYNALRKRSWFRPVAAAFAVLALVVVYGAFRLQQQTDMEQKDTAPKRWMTLLAVQPNLPVKMDYFALTRRNGPLEQATTFTLDSARRHPEAEIIVWPEVPVPLACACARGDRSRLFQRFLADLGKPFLFECVEYPAADVAGVAGASASARPHNSAVIAEDGRACRPVYRKLRLFPFGEYLPGEKQFPGLRKMFPGASRFLPGSEMVLFDLDNNRKIIPSLCYEALFVQPSREGVKRGGDVMIAMADDAWFDSEEAESLHLSVVIFRSVENRVPMVRVTNSGYGAFIKATGEIIPETLTPSHVRTAATGRLYLPSKRPLYFYLGDLFLWAAFFYGVLRLVFMMIRRIRR